MLPRHEVEMTGKRPNDEFGDAIRAVFRPASPEPTDTTRVALLYPKDDELKQAINDAGLVITYSHTPKHYDEKLDFEKVPDFDLVVANLPDDSKAKVEAMRYVSRYLYIRRPVSFVLVSERFDSKFLEFAQERTWRMGYELSNHNAIMGDRAEPKLFAVLIGALPGHAPPWPSGLQAGSDKDDNEGPDRSLDKCQEIFGRQPMMGLEHVIRVVARHVREESDYFKID